LPIVVCKNFSDTKTQLLTRSFSKPHQDVAVDIKIPFLQGDSMTFGKMRIALALASINLIGGSAIGATEWQIDPAHSSANFAVTHLMISTVHGSMSGLEGGVTYDDKDVTKSKVEATIDAKTISTNNSKRDDHLKSADFFDVKKFPKIKFVSKDVKRDQAGNLEIKGDLSMHGITKEVTLLANGPTPPVKDPMGNMRVGFIGDIVLKRSDFGLKWNKTVEGGGVVVSDEVRININLSTIAKNSNQAKAPSTDANVKKTK